MKRFNIASPFGLLAGLIFMGTILALVSQPVADRRPTILEIDQLVGLTNNVQTQLNTIRTSATNPASILDAQGNLDLASNTTITNTLFDCFAFGGSGGGHTFEATISGAGGWAVGTGHTISGDIWGDCIILGGGHNRIEHSLDNGIFSGYQSILYAADNSVILGGLLQHMDRSSGSAIIGGFTNVLKTNTLSLAAGTANKIEFSTNGFAIGATNRVSTFDGMALGYNLTNTARRTVDIGSANATKISITETSLVARGSIELGAVGGPTITTGSGAPAATQPDGSLYLRSNGSFFVRSNAAWVQMTGAF